MTGKGQFEAERQEVVEYAHRIVAAGLVAGTSGNVSRRVRREEGDLMAITASGAPYDRMTTDDIVVVDLGEIEPVFGEGVPSSESLCHAAAYQARGDVGAVIHTHSVYASAFAVAGKPITPVLDEQVIYVGGTVNVAEYAPSSSQELADAAVRALGDGAAVLLRHHGVMSVGRDLAEACAVAELVERVAKIHLMAALLGGATELPTDVIASERQIYRMMKGFRE